MSEATRKMTAAELAIGLRVRLSDAGVNVYRSPLKRARAATWRGVIRGLSVKYPDAANVLWEHRHYVSLHTAAHLEVCDSAEQDGRPVATQGSEWKPRTKLHWAAMASCGCVRVGQEFTPCDRHMNLFRQEER